MSDKIIRIIRWLIVGTTFPFTGTAVLANDPAPSTFVELTHQGDAFFQQGHFQRAAKSWENNLALVECTINANPCIDLLTRLAAAYQALQKHSAMFQTLNQALSLASVTHDKGRSALVRSQLSDAWLSIGASKKLSGAKAKKPETVAEKGHSANAHTVTNEKTATEQQPRLEKACSLVELDYLKNACLLAIDSVADARVTNDPDVLARALNSQGNVLVIMGLFPEAIDTYQESMQVAEQASDSTLAIKVFLNGLNVDFMSGNLFKEEMITLLDQVWKQIEKLPDTYDKARICAQSVGR
ncbi:MAG TPA: hypothetical protein ENG03_09505 [Thioploca sp.]|nr:MAG: hypothetical protein DRR19_31125 [Gammaproteobacteria bacterium]HDN27312.1 hypothetical protein [Thioploca sp.]